MIAISKPYIGEAEKQAVLEVLESGMLVQGSRTARLEERFTAICGTQYAIATSSGTTALHVALLAHGIGPGDEVITTPFTFMASVNAILYVGARPVFVDIEDDTFNLNPQLIEAALSSKTKAILPVHLYGYPCNMDAILNIADKYGLFVIEDACQAVGARYKGKVVGSFGTGCFSLYATKNIMAVEGGMITTNNEAFAQLCRMIRNHGMQRRYYHDMLGYNFRTSDLNSAIGLAQVERLIDFTEKRRANAAYLNEHITSVKTPQVKEGYEHVWHQYTIQVGSGRNRDAAVKQLNDAGVGTGIFYPIPAYRQAHLIEAGYGSLSFPVTECMVNEVISLPVHPQVNQNDLEKIAFEVNKL
ncbi:MAG TPA: DegT/DnrJ/EryC1/StrS family aminotransferase [Anaerolineales bacterium]|nr:DegT/DnrJ/EryC1/StrS family aminotransferase [Anaerolineales bacterium]